MSTLIAKLNTNGTVAVSYVAYDSFPRPVAETLAEHYTDAKKVERLFGLGSLLFVAPELGRKHEFHTAAKNRPEWTCSYLRDKGIETDTMHIIADEHTLVEYAVTNHYHTVCLYKNNAWHILRVQKVFVPIAIAK